jgi:hypothetical protein
MADNTDSLIRLSEPAERLVRRKPLFIPLITKFYEAFERGDKTTELRMYGQRWNEKTCYVGREVILSKGYGKKHRLEGIIVDVETSAAHDLHDHKEALLRCFGHLNYRVIVIHIQTPPLRLL